MEKLVPKLFTVMKDYTKERFVKDIVAGIIVAIIALPLSIALALASGVTPEKGIYTAITAGFVISFLGGSRVQIAGPTAAFATIVASIAARNGMDGLIVATIMAGIILMLMGFLRLGSLIRFIPYTITTGFTSGIAVTIFIGQIKDFLGLTVVSEEPLIETVDKLKAVFEFIGTNCLVLRMRSVNAIDATAMHNLEKLYDICEKKGVKMVLSHVNEQPMTIMKKAGFDKKIGKENFCAHIDDALKRAAEI